MRPIYLAMTAMAIIFRSSFGLADSPSPPQAKPTIDEARVKLSGDWKPYFDEECVRQDLENTARNSKFLDIDGELVQDPTEAQRRGYIEKIPERVPGVVKRYKEAPDTTFFRFNADGMFLRVIKIVPVPGFPQVQRTRWRLAEKNGILVLTAGEGGQVEESMLTFADPNQLVLKPLSTNAHRPLVKWVRVTESPKWVSDLIESETKPNESKPKF
ncbi:MAG: hypothetical protein K8T91_24830 [Planctomycetes bacterium]|nr:hypothetical protein [Planctomycetota bacterium]